MTYEIKYAYTCHMGNKRRNNEDNFWCCGDNLHYKNKGLSRIIKGSSMQKEFPAFAVFDGMGGESCGEIAAGIASDTFGAFYQENKNNIKKNTVKFINKVCEKMNVDICRYGIKNKITSMGTTVALGIFGSKGIYFGNLGDSKIYQFENNILDQISTDHVIQRSFSKKPPLTQYLGTMEDEIILEPSICHLNYKEGNKYLLCSDGVTDMLSEKEITDIFCNKKEITKIVEELRNASLKKGGYDNITIILCEICKNETMNIVKRIRNIIKNW